MPQSLYQLMTYTFFATQIAKPFGNDYDKLVKQFQIEKYTKDVEEYGITKACNRLMQDEETQKLFWEMNAYASNLWNECSGNVPQITNYLLDQFKVHTNQNNEKSIRPLDMRNIMMSYNHKRIVTLVGLIGNNPTDLNEWHTPPEWSIDKFQKLKEYITNIIVSENNNSDYIIYRGDTRKLTPEIAYRKSICFSDGLFSGFICDPGASAFSISDKFRESKLYVLKLERTKLLNCEYPIYLPNINPLSSTAGNGELFHIRTKCVQAVQNDRGEIDESALSIQSITGIAPIVAGYELDQTPEYFTTQKPEMLEVKWNRENKNDEYAKIGKGAFDKDGAEKLKEMINNIKEVPANGIF